MYIDTYLFPSRTTSRSELSGEHDTDESLKQSSKKRKKKKKKHHHYKKTKKKNKGDSSSSESDLDTKHVKDKAAGSSRNHEKEAAGKYVFINTMQDVSSFCSCTCLFNFMNEILTTSVSFFSKLYMTKPAFKAVKIELELLVSSYLKNCDKNIL